MVALPAAAIEPNLPKILLSAARFSEYSESSSELYSDVRGVTLSAFEEGTLFDDNSDPTMIPPLGLGAKPVFGVEGTLTGGGGFAFFSLAGCCVPDPDWFKGRDNLVASGCLLIGSSDMSGAWALVYVCGDGLFSILVGAGGGGCFPSFSPRWESSP